MLFSQPQKGERILQEKGWPEMPAHKLGEGLFRYLLLSIGTDQDAEKPLRFRFQFAH